ncbi:hypothetical protein CFC21_104338 [Triticum aestivum]|uniref:Uncharacterized protein n=2 Tax=Triticum aestivum TaxID=4565 RepID=A0A9R1MA29_WHEAT|nr:hypothetical protein CFC21_104338 [Triticum aestivum]
MRRRRRCWRTGGMQGARSVKEGCTTATAMVTGTRRARPKLVRWLFPSVSRCVSQSPCTIKPLVAALSFHQFFEGFALGDCISQARLKGLSTLLMAFFFAITTPTGIAVGVAMASFYDPYSPRALVVEGILDSMSAGILIYMALVDLIAADFLGQKMSSCPARLQAGAYIALFLGAIAMASLAIWT